VTQPCGPIPNWEILKTEQPGRASPIRSRSRSPAWTPAAGRDDRRPARAAAGRFVRNGRTVGDRLFAAPNLRVRRGSSLTWQFSGAELHNLTLANGPLGIGSDNLDRDRTFTQRFDRTGTYRFFCAFIQRRCSSGWWSRTRSV
jgi:plastocyanin